MANEYQSLFDQLAAQRAEAQARINEQKAKAQSSFAEQEKLYTQALKGVRTDYSANIAPINQGLESDYQASLASNQQSSLARAAELRAQGVNPASFGHRRSFGCPFETAWSLVLPDFASSAPSFSINSAGAIDCSSLLRSMTTIAPFDGSRTTPSNSDHGKYFGLRSHPTSISVGRYW